MIICKTWISGQNVCLLHTQLVEQWREDIGLMRSPGGTHKCMLHLGAEIYISFDIFCTRIPKLSLRQIVSQTNSTSFLSNRSSQTQPPIQDTTHCISNNQLMYLTEFKVNNLYRDQKLMSQNRVYIFLHILSSPTLVP